MSDPTSILILDIGSGTQDVLYFQPGQELENCPKFILPSPARRIGGRIRELTKAGEAIYLHGRNMGGGFFRAAMAHLDAGLPLAAHPEAVLAMADDPSWLEEKGLKVSERLPAGYRPVPLADYDPGFWQAFLAMAGLDYPDLVSACAQDHGFHPGESNRFGRFELWKRFLTEAHGDPEALVFTTPPPELTRLAALQRAIGGGPVSDTGSAAVLGAMFDPAIERESEEYGITLVNAGNSHIIAFLLYGGRMWGVYEQHTGLVDAEAVGRDLNRFRRGELTFQEVFDARGHGVMTLDLPPEAKGFAKTYALGPRRAMLAEMDAVFPSPGGDMMLAGCFGLLKGLGYSHVK